MSVDPSVRSSWTRESIADVVQGAPTIPLVAREAELGALRDAWASARAGEAAAVLVAGEAGVGKTKLVSELATLATTDGALVLVGHCVGLGQAAPPYLPVIEILSQIRERAPQSVAEPVADLLDDNPAVDQGRLFEGVLGALTAEPEDRPLLVVIEDLHWSDASTRDLLLFLLARLGAHRLLLVLTYRSDDLHRQHPLRPMLATVARMRKVERLEVAPFDPEQARTFVRALTPDVELGDAVVADVADRSEGNAFFAEELLSAASSGGRVGLTDVLTSVLLDRTERLSPAAQRVVRAAAIVGQRDIGEESLVALVGLPAADVEPALRECVQSHVLVVTPAGAYEFRHALLREAVYTDLLPGERTRLHTAYVEVLQAQQPSGWRAAQAFHATRAGDVATAFAAHVAAAGEAQAMAAHGDALTHLEQALSLRSAATDPESMDDVAEIELVLRASDAAVASGRGDRAIAFARSAQELADAGGDLLVRADVRRRLAKLSYGEGDWREAERLINQAWTLVEDEPATAERAWVLSTMSFGEATPDRRAYAERALADARAVGAGGAEADALVSLSYLALREGDVEGALASLESARERARRAGSHETELRAWFNTAMAQHELGELDAAAATVAAALVVAEERGRRWSSYGRELAWLAQIVDHARGEWDAVLQRTRLLLPGAIGIARTMMLATAALAHAGRGDWDELDRVVAEVRPPGGDLRAAALHREEEVRLAAWAAIEADLWRGRGSEVAPALQEAFERVEHKDDPAEIRLIALLLAALADVARHPARAGASQQTGRDAVAEALTRLDRAVQDSRPRADALGPEAWLWHARGRAEAARADRVEEAEHWRAVVELATPAFRPHEALSRWRLAEALLEVGDGPAEAAVAELERAGGIATDIGARPQLEAIQATARRFRVPLPGARTTGPGPLTPRERAVLELVARGMTNRAVGSELFISEKTVSVHLSRVMAKLGASGRTEAVALAMARGLLG